MLLWYSEETAHPPYVTLRNKKVPELLPNCVVSNKLLNQHIDLIIRYIDSTTTHLARDERGK